MTMAGRPELLDNPRPELVAFYERMLALPAAGLEQGGLNLAQVRSNLEKFR